MQAFRKEKNNLFGAASEYSWEKKIVKQVILFLTSVDEPGSFEKHQ